MSSRVVAMDNSGSRSMLEKQISDIRTTGEFRERVEQITGIDFEGAEPHNLRRKDWKNLVHFLETEVGDSADTSETESR